MGKIYGGYFDDEVDAAKAVNQLCEKCGILPKNLDINEAHINDSENVDQPKYRNKRKRSEKNIIEEDEENCPPVNMFLKNHILSHSESFLNHFNNFIFFLTILFFSKTFYLFELLTFNSVIMTKIIFSKFFHKSIRFAKNFVILLFFYFYSIMVHHKSQHFACSLWLS